MSATPERPETAGEPDIAAPANEPDRPWDSAGPAVGLAVDTLRDAAPPAPRAPGTSVGDDLWATEEVDRETWSPARLVVRARRAATRPNRHAAARARRPRKPRQLRAALAMLVVLALSGTFFAWVTAEPIWLAVGRGDTGTATVAGCVGAGVTQRCRGSFTAEDGRYTTELVRVLGVPGTQTAPGTQVRAQMVNAGSGAAYLDNRTVNTLRWLLGIMLVLLCGLGIVFATGALRLEDRRARRTAAVCGLAAPLLVTVGFLAATY
ncbi:hypothetical protein GCM10009687_61380 [Asanoa iriomotensis]|uniref:hypothetical protein n=1 Tax=Asanoa iriomotensis TaxID=234613 RepID=UPI0031E43A20